MNYHIWIWGWKLVRFCITSIMLLHAFSAYKLLLVLTCVCIVVCVHTCTVHAHTHREGWIVLLTLNPGNIPQRISPLWSFELSNWLWSVLWPGGCDVSCWDGKLGWRGFRTTDKWWKCLRVCGVCVCMYECAVSAWVITFFHVCRIIVTLCFQVHR